MPVNKLDGQARDKAPAEAEAGSVGDAVPNVHKPWNFDDAFKYAPPRPEGDSWDILLDPLMKQDKIRCDAWKDEVQNLLIFAGLFSAVVTTFIIESYKSLQPDPNDFVIDLLSHISTRLNASLEPSATITSMAQTFSPTSSSVRVNSFWFTSLVLSLTTVLVGIIALQWLREHQFYSTDLSPREKYSLYCMREDALKTWQVDKIFNSLPLLLQCALILFLGGVVDFLQAIGNIGVFVPVAIIVGLTLLFLVMTTVLPSLQVSLLYYDIFLNWDITRNDPAWLAIRDGYMRFVYKRSSSAEYISRTDVVPIFDIVRGLLDQAYHTSLFPSTYHCLAEISDLVTQPPHSSGFTSADDAFRQSLYLHDLVASKDDTPLLEYFGNDSGAKPDSLSESSIVLSTASNLTLLLHQQIVESFIPYHFSRQIFALPSKHRIELRLRLLRSFFNAKHLNFSSDLRIMIPECLILRYYHASAIIDNEEDDMEAFTDFAWQIAHLTQVILEQISHRPDSIAHHPSVQHDIILPFMETSGCYANCLLRQKNPSSSIISSYSSVFRFIEEILLKDMAEWTETNIQPSLFFYTSSLLAYNILLDWGSKDLNQPISDPSFRSMCAAICAYREGTIDAEIFDPDIEEQFTRDPDVYYFGRIYDTDSPRTFSSQWWARLAIYKATWESTSVHQSYPSSVDSVAEIQ
ncbi:hypothetical protein JR316_0001295 [Psilocybe cubensis]|uniref:DUF6535 domain-containing protein n=2 Tax=Psilocybe cubensis TaxID=181762 RepID=A0A8H7YBL1_PSICU|nr:hypothetical protein JR316_0001295 [Psilocybe cubensis]KAH9487226.1 hypothetical protein JR316_0001295 [Psilocybe cubensis]